ncbi:hypothetical protein BJX66DRAFT_342199 [Aspergillus keveii]|uniref:Uncharacterized protein n=1 Tax=Aspergillus keveii TaxID=714993 RepID=A0ABR4FTS3_9EURO
MSRTQSLLVAQVADDNEWLVGARELLGHSASFLTNALTVECHQTRSDCLDIPFQFNCVIVQSVQVKRLACQFENIMRQLKQHGFPGDEVIPSIDLATEGDLQLLAHQNAAISLMNVWSQPPTPAVQDYDHNAVAWGCVFVVLEGERTAQGAVRGNWGCPGALFLSNLRTVVSGDEVSPQGFFSNYTPHGISTPQRLHLGMFVNEHLEMSSGPSSNQPGSLILMTPID